VEEGTPQNITNTIWAIAKRGQTTGVLAGLIDGELVAEKMVRDGTPQNISKIAWALSTLGHGSAFSAAHRALRRGQ